MRHLTAEEVYRLLFEGGHDAGLATVYRVLSCGRVQEFHDEAIERQQKLIAAEHGFEVDEHSHILYGRCTKNPCEHRRRDSGYITRRIHELPP